LKGKHPGEGGTQKRKLGNVHDDLSSTSPLLLRKSKRKKSQGELDKYRLATELIIEKDTWVAAESQKLFCKNIF
jgi:hypothetical protein